MHFTDKLLGILHRCNRCFTTIHNAEDILLARFKFLKFNLSQYIVFHMYVHGSNVAGTLACLANSEQDSYSQRITTSQQPVV
jgi:hypothetical protein